MSNQISTTAPTPAARVTETPVAEPVKPTATTEEPGAKQANTRTQLNISIMQASMSVSISSQNEPLALLFKTAVDSLNETLKPEFGENAIQNAMNQDNTPDGTAGRIVSMSTGFFDAYKQIHKDQDPEVTLKNFMAAIRDGFETGYKEASNILDGLNVLNGDIASNIDKTYQLVTKGYSDFEAAQAGTAAKKDGEEKKAA